MRRSVHFYLPHKTSSDVSSKDVLLSTLTHERYGFDVVNTRAKARPGSLLLFWTSTFPSVKFIEEWCSDNSILYLFNHFPRSVEVGHKRRLYKRMLEETQAGRQFLPLAFDCARCAPEAEQSKLLLSLLPNTALEGNRRKYWITKPHRAGGGRRVEVWETATLVEALRCAWRRESMGKQGPREVAAKCGDKRKRNKPLNSIDRKDGFRLDCVIQAYVHNPFLIEGRKCDFRAYVLVCADKIYVYKEGLVRRASRLYTLDHESLGDPYIHVTNNVVNKRNIPAKGCRARFGASENLLFSTLVAKDERLDAQIWVEVIFSQLKTIAYRTFSTGLLQNKRVQAALESHGMKGHEKVSETEKPSRVSAVAKLPRAETAPRRQINCFELFGVDVLLDDQLGLHLLEVNHMPELETSAHAKADRAMNATLVQDLFDIVLGDGATDTNLFEAVATEEEVRRT